MTDYYTYFSEQTEDMLKLLQAMVEFESPSNNKQLVDQLGNYLKNILEESGAQVEVHPREVVGNIVFATWNADAAGKPILFLTHMDTVWQAGTLPDVVPIKRDAERLHGPGALDMKAGIMLTIATIHGLQAISELPPRPIWLLITSDEETGSEHSTDLILELAHQCELCLVMEPSMANEALKTWRKGIAHYTIQAKGIASHAGVEPEKGLNAIIELAHQAIELHSMNQLRKGTSVSVTLFDGGTAMNVIPAHASCEVDVRFLLAEEAHRIDEAVKALQPKLFGSELEITGGIKRMPMERNAQMIQTFGKVKALAAQAGLPTLYEDGTGGVSDGNLVAAAGIPTLDGMGAYGDGMHALHEHVLISSLPRRAALIAMILKHWTT